MGKIEREVTLTEGAKPGIPKLQVVNIDSHSAEFIMLVSLGVGAVRCLSKLNSTIIFCALLCRKIMLKCS